MQDKSVKVNFPVKLKIILFCSTLLAVAMFAYLSFALDLFKKDKSAYIFESSLGHSDFLSEKIENQFQSATKTISLIQKSGTNKRVEIASKLFELNQDLIYYGSYRLQGKKLYNIKRFFNENILGRYNLTKRYYDDILKNYPIPTDTITSQRPSIFFQESDKNIPHLVVAIRDQKIKNRFLILRLATDTIKETLYKNKLYRSYLVDTKFNQILKEENKEVETKDLSNLIKDSETRGVKKFYRGEGKDQEEFLMAFNRLNSFGLIQITEISTGKAFRAAKLLTNKSLLFGIIVISISIIIGIFVSKTLSKPIEILMKGTDKVSEGNYKMELPITSGDEIGVLTSSFNNMCKKIVSSIDELKGAYDQMTQMDKLATLGEISTGISHEINNPLSIANGHMSFIRKEITDGGKDQEKLDKYMGTVEKSLTRISDIVKNMKKFAHKSTSELEPVDVEKLADEAIETLTNLFTKSSVKFTKGDFPKNATIMADPIGIEQVMVNLMKNAHDALTEKSVENPYVKVSAVEDIDSGMIKISIKDNGPGIPKDVQKNIFKPFFTTKGVGKGTGLGLSISFKIIESAKGKIELVSEENQGAEFILHLPKADGQMTTTTSAISLDEFNSSDKTKVITLLKDCENQQIVEGALSDQDFLGVSFTSYESFSENGKGYKADKYLIEYDLPGEKGDLLSKELHDSGFSGDVYLMITVDHIRKFKECQENYNVKDFILIPLDRSQIIKKIG